MSKPGHAGGPVLLGREQRPAQEAQANCSASQVTSTDLDESLDVSVSHLSSVERANSAREELAPE